MSIIVTIKKTGQEIEFSSREEAVKHLLDINIIDERIARLHPNNAIARMVKRGLIDVVSKKGSKKKLQPPTPPTTTEAPQPIDVVDVDVDDLKRVYESDENADESNMFKMMAKMIAPFVKPDYEFAAATISKLVADAVSQIKPDKIQVTRVDDVVVELDKQHYAFKRILNAVAQRVHLMLVGPAGSGKTTCAHNVAVALGLEFYSMSVGQQTTKSDIFGFVDAHSNYKRTQFRDAFENGGVFLFDEIDAGNAGVLTAINASLANGMCAFPDGMVKRSDDFVCIAAGNTFGRGADRQYVGRQQLDAATLDRFAVIDFDYDEELELEISGNRNWTRQVQKMRANAMANNLRVVISPRASINGAKLLAAGFTESEVKEMIVFKGIGEKERNIIENGKA